MWTRHASPLVPAPWRCDGSAEPTVVSGAGHGTGWSPGAGRGTRPSWQSRSLRQSVGTLRPSYYRCLRHVHSARSAMHGNGEACSQAVLFSVTSVVGQQQPQQQQLPHLLPACSRTPL
eukprot:TRINITY_DN22341_c0_g1_i3.p3 TRINITY_DN22341_c0_g1~~TRINITY_DN22341_c0_g1_i3.p3  ORF type:complete len:118 (+),score=11.79 TRINITY_DN22341_c0_g1_i3:249-602(+)